jgi:hypothetical protein
MTGLRYTSNQVHRSIVSRLHVRAVAAWHRYSAHPAQTPSHARTHHRLLDGARGLAVQPAALVGVVLQLDVDIDRVVPVQLEEKALLRDGILPREDYNI